MNGVVYKFENGFRREAEIMYRRLIASQFSPAWSFEVGSMSITLPEREIPLFRQMQRNSPSYWGNAPEV